ncbi:MAG: winged helix-turn-helix transcriptional regulator [Thermoplasmatota archaeon]
MTDVKYLRDDIRGLILEHIREHPGISFQVLRSAFKIPSGTLRYHLDHLVKKRKIVQEKVRNQRHYFSYLRWKFPQCPDNISLNGRQEVILDLILENPGIGRSEILNRSRTDRNTLTGDLKQLRKYRLVRKVSTEGGSDGYRAITRDDLRSDMFRILVRKYVDNDIDREAFFDMMKELEIS